MFAIARFTPSGQLDATFGNGGLVTTDISGVFPAVSAVIVQPNGQIVVGGASASGIRHQPVNTVLVRYNSNGSLDTTFGTGGIVQEPTAVGEPLALAQLSNGDYLAVTGNQLSPEEGVVVEFSSTGVLQSTVTPATVVAASPSTPELVNPVIFQPNGDYIWAETVGNGFQRQAAEAFRFSETGVADPSFTSIKITFGGQNGKRATGNRSPIERANRGGRYVWLGAAQFQRPVGYHVWQRRLAGDFPGYRPVDTDRWKDCCHRLERYGSSTGAVFRELGLLFGLADPQTR